MNGSKYGDRAEEEEEEEKLVFYVKSDSTIDVALRLDSPHIYLALVVFANFFFFFTTSNHVLDGKFSIFFWGNFFYRENCACDCMEKKRRKN